MTKSQIRPNVIAEIVRAGGNGTETPELTKKGKSNKRLVKPDEVQEAWFAGLIDEEGYLSSGKVFPSRLNPDVLWEILGDTLNRTSGASITKDKVWREVGIWEEGSRGHQDWMKEEMFATLVSLDLAQKIKFLASGSIWEISALPR